MAEFKKYPKRVTPRGTSIYPKLNEPDTKFDKAGVYEVKLAIDAEAPGLAALREEVAKLAQERLEEEQASITETLTKQGKKGLIAKAVAALVMVDPFTVEEDGETGEETGRVIIKAKMKASGVSAKTQKPWKRKPTIFDARGKEIKNPPQIGGGSEMKLSVELVPYYAASDKKIGVSFRLEAAQVLKLVQFGARDAAGFGFGAEDGDELEEQESGFGDETGGAEGGAAGDEDDDL